MCPRLTLTASTCSSTSSTVTRMASSSRCMRPRSSSSMGASDACNRRANQSLLCGFSSFSDKIWRKRGCPLSIFSSCARCRPPRLSPLCVDVSSRCPLSPSCCPTPPHACCPCRGQGLRLGRAQQGRHRQRRCLRCYRTFSCVS